MKQAYKDLHKLGMAHSAEAWLDGKLVGGLYGVSIGGAFFGESMFSTKPNASKFALISLCEWLHERGFTLIDCQIYSSHLEKLGAKLVSRAWFLDALEQALELETVVGSWTQ
jgi:leucyl/phenylalanyl-tRNA--protein transferase